MGILNEDLKNKKQQWIGIALNLAYALTEVSAGLHYNSAALLTDAGHNFGDAVSLGISLWIEKKQPRLAAFINAAVLLTSAGFLGCGAFVRLFNPEVVSSGNIVWVAALGIIINGVSAFFFFPHRHKPNSKAVYLHFLIDALVSLVVIITGIVISYTHLYWLDPFISLVIMFAIIFCQPTFARR